MVTANFPAFATQGTRIDVTVSSLGDAKSLITHPATTTHQRLSPEVRAELGIFDRSVRLSIGLEDVNDLMADLDQALVAVR
jgi:O-succinylhomoserine sulfhydrylase